MQQLVVYATCKLWQCKNKRKEKWNVKRTQKGKMQKICLIQLFQPRATSLLLSLSLFALNSPPARYSATKNCKQLS